MKRKRVLINWIISYLIILLIPFVTILINYWYSMQSLGQKIYQSYELIIDNLGSGTDNRLDEVYDYYSYLYYDDALRTLQGNKEKDSQFYYDAMEFKNQINTYKTYGSEISCLLYFPELEYILSTKSGQDAESYYNSYRSVAENVCDYEAWIDKLSGQYKGQLFVDNYFHYATGEKCIVYANSISGKRNQPVNIFISIPVSVVSETTKELSEDSCFFMMVDDSMEMIWTNEGAVSGTSDLQKIYDAMKEDDSDSGYYLVERTSDIKDKISYGMLVSSKSYKQQQQQVKNIFCVSLVLTLMVAFVVLEMLIKRNYRPITQLMDKIIGSPKADGNEYELIEHAYEEQMKEKHLLHERLLTHEEMLQSNFLLQMMKGRKVDSHEGKIQIPMQQKYVLIGIMIPLPNREQADQDEIVLFAIDNIFTELMRENRYYKIEDGNCLFYLFMVDEKEENWRKECLKKLDYLNRMVTTWWKQGLFIAVSKTEENLEKIDTQYRDIMEDFQDRKLLRMNTVVDISNKFVSLSANQKLVQSIRDLIEENYENCNLNVTGLAEELGRTPKYISEVFKEETGESILYAINHKRITKAQALIRSGQYSLTKICEMTGYSNMNTFRRNFQQITGTSPGNYAERKGDEQHGECNTDET